MIDTHCHIHDVDVYDYAFSKQQGPKKVLDRADLTPEKLVSRAVENGISQMICIGTTHEDSMAAKALAEKFPGTVFWSYGIHPDECNLGFSIDSFVGAPVAIGEVGLDYKDGMGRRSEQIRLFEEMLQLAKDHNLPCIFHVREAFDDFFAVLDNFPGVKGVVHSFSDSPENLKKSLARDFYIGVNGLATFVNLPTPPLEKLLLETDAPFLTPVPWRGKINEPAHIKDIANFVGKKFSVSLDEVEKQTTDNAKNLFKL